MNAATRLATGPEAALDPWAAQFAAHGVRAAGRILLDLRNQHEEDGEGGAQSLIRTGVTWSTLQLQGHVRRQFPDDAFVCVTDTDTAGGTSAAALAPTRRTWVAQPLEGTERFGRLGDPEWSVHLSLWLPGPGLAAAAVALPALCEVATTSPATGRFLSPALPPAQRGSTRILLAEPDTDPTLVSAVARRLAAEPVLTASPGAMVMSVVRGDADAYLCGGRHFTSLLVPSLARAAGLVVRPLASLRLPALDPTALSPTTPDGDAPTAQPVLICRSDTPRLSARPARSQPLPAARH